MFKTNKTYECTEDYPFRDVINSTLEQVLDTHTNNKSGTLAIVRSLTHPVWISIQKKECKDRGVEPLADPMKATERFMVIEQRGNWFQVLGKRLGWIYVNEDLFELFAEIQEK